ncbi:MAG: D-alanyl-lipoteichoic acid biosynthesis protein DltD [Desulfosporosinus sp.]|nr:D-alanyl-lipoteichoic acid biosynthesis protein DltD [Desulfosporosinus sp.]
MKNKRLRPLLIAFLLFCLTILYTGEITQIVANHFWLTPGVIETVGLAPPKDQEVLLGSIFQRKAMETGDVLPIYGSSELETGHAFNPTRVFANRPTRFTPFIIGRGSCQTLVHILNIAADHDINDKKIVITFSPDWYEDLHGLSNDRLAMNSSPLKVYDVLFNPTLSRQLKDRILLRISDLPQVVNDDYLLHEYLAAYRSSNWKSTLQCLFLWPVARLEYASLQVQDARDVKRTTSELDRRMVTELASPTPDQPINWEKLDKLAVTEAQTNMQNNLNIADNLYAQYDRPNIKDSQKGVNKLTPSVEYDDLQLMLDLLHENHVKALFVMIPYNGLFRDYTGLSSVIRQAYYAKISQIIQGGGFQFVNLSSHEKELYFMQDASHLGWKGWAELDQVLDDFYHTGHASGDGSLLHP